MMVQYGFREREYTGFYSLGDFVTDYFAVFVSGLLMWIFAPAIVRRALPLRDGVSSASD